MLGNGARKIHFKKKWRRSLRSDIKADEKSKTLFLTLKMDERPSKLEDI